MFTNCQNRPNDKMLPVDESMQNEQEGNVQPSYDSVYDSLVVRVLPVDESSLDSTFIVFKSRLLNALDSKDVGFITSILDDNIKVSFGGDDGKKDFINYWNLDSERSEFWLEMKTCLGLGGTLENYEEKMFVFPYLYSRWPDEFDAFEFGAIISPQVKLKSKPDNAAKTISFLNYEIVNLLNLSGKDWVELETQDGTIGYVRQNELRSPIDYRAGFMNQGGGWKMVFFVSGD